MDLQPRRLLATLLGVTLVAAAVFLLGGGASLGRVTALQVDWSEDPQALEGAAVEIDGAPAGVLRPFGGLARFGVEVRPGAHEVRLSAPGLECEPVTVVVESGEVRRVVVAREVRPGPGGARTRFVLRPAVAARRAAR